MSLRFHILTLLSNATVSRTSLASGWNLTICILSEWAGKSSSGSLVGLNRPSSGIFQTRRWPSSQAATKPERKMELKIVIPFWIKTKKVIFGISFHKARRPSATRTLTIVVKWVKCKVKNCWSVDKCRLDAIRDSARFVGVKDGNFSSGSGNGDGHSVPGHVWSIKLFCTPSFCQNLPKKLRFARTNPGILPDPW